MKRICCTGVISVLMLITLSSASAPIIVQKSPDLPSHYVIDKVPQLYPGEGECGPTALAMVLNYYGIKKTKDDLKYSLRWRREGGVSYQDMFNFPWGIFGLKAELAQRGNIEMVMQYVTKDRPVIVRQWENDTGKFFAKEGHYRVVIGYDHEKQKIYLRDPADPKRGFPSLSYKQFLDLWDMSNHRNASMNLMLILIPEKEASLLTSETVLKSQIVPFPSELNIIPPDLNLPEAIAAFSGIWEGSWGEILPSKLAIEKIDQKEATVVYGWADDLDGRFLGGWDSLKAKVVGTDVIEWGGGNSPKFTFTMGKDFKSIDGKRESQGGISQIKMTKKK
jgi:hypothetical protein